MGKHIFQGGRYKFWPGANPQQLISMPAETSHSEQIREAKQDGLPTVRCQPWPHTINQPSGVRDVIQSFN